MSFESSIRPNFFIVGAPKSGTTSLYEYLRQHPEIFMSEVKEPFFFGSDLTVAGYPAIRDEATYLSLFRGAGEARCIGEASTWYLRSTEAAREIKEFNPKAKIVIMLRNPIDMMYSLHGYCLSYGTENIFDFEKAIEAQSDRKCGHRLPKAVPFLATLLYMEAATYSPQIERYFKIFGRESVHVSIFDEFVLDTSRVYRQVLGFLGVNVEFQPVFTVENPARVLRNLPVKRFLKSHPWVTSLFGKAFSPAMRHQIGNVLSIVLDRRQRPPKMSPVLRCRLQERFRPEVERLSELLSKDLSYWCRVS